jgi:RNA polymerase sigma-70 factor (ECF subfamily)
MSDDAGRPEAPGPRTGGGGFATTRWSMVLAAGADSTEDGRAALESLFRAYWDPLYTFARRSGADREEAQDLVQGFFAELYEKDRLRQADRGRGRFRTFLLAAFRHHWSHERERARAEKRGGGRTPLPLDFESGEDHYLREPADERTPERLFERRWALTVLDAALERLRDAHERAGRLDLFDALRPTIGAGGPDGDARWAEVGARLGMSEGAVKVAAHRLRRRYRELLREIIAETVADPSEVDDEIRHLMSALAG